MELSILIINWNTRDLLVQCLASVYAFPPAAPFEVIVVDNASTDGSAEAVRERFPQVIIIRNTENAGFARANNQAIRASRGRQVLLLNSDTIVMANTFEPLLACLRERPAAGMAGPMLLNFDGSFQGSYADFPTLFRQGMEFFGLARRLWGPHYPSHREGESQNTRAVDWVSGTCILVRRGCIDQVGLLDERFFMYGEEVDWCYRMRQAGWETVYCPLAQIRHLGGQSSTSVPVRKYVQLQQARVGFFHKHRGRLQTGILIAMLRLSSALKALYFSVAERDTRHRDMRAAYLTVARTRFRESLSA